MDIDYPIGVGYPACYSCIVALLILKRILGVLLVLFGLFALVTPFTPGAWLAFVGLELLGLSFLLPKVIREPWEKLKATLYERWLDFVRRMQERWKRVWGKSGEVRELKK